MTETIASPSEGLRVVGGVGMGYPPPQGGYAAATYMNSQPDKPKAAWVEVHPNSRVTVYAGKVEYGQNIRSGFAIEVADELRVALESIDVVLGDTDLTPWDMGTFGSQSTMRVGLQLRKAAATARQTLLELAANRLDLPVSDLVCGNGRVASKRDTNRGLSYGELVTGERLERDIMDDAPLTPPDEFSVMGEATARIDAIGRVTGKTEYSQDVILPGMLYARVLRPPAFGAKLTSFDASAAEKVAGVVQVAHEGDLVAVLAENDEAADKGIRFVRAQWDRSGIPQRWDMPELLPQTAHDTQMVQQAGSLAEGFAAADQVLETTYFVPYITNAPMEPKAAVASWDGDRITVWAGTQRPFGARTEVAEALGIAEDRVRVIAPDIGGGFGSKSFYPQSVEAAMLSRIAGRPVRVALSRAEEMAWATFRPAASITVKSGFKKDGTIVAWDFHAIHSSERAMIGRRSIESPYDVPHMEVKVSIGESPLHAGSYRSLGAAVNNFARESHFDEIAAATGNDPAELRLRHLRNPQDRRVLERAMRAFGWTAAKPQSGRGVGVALGFDVGSYVAMCLELGIRDGEVEISRVNAALDCGLAVNPEGAIAQVEGAVVMGIGTTLYEAIEVQGGRLVTSGFARYRVPRITDSPRIDVELVGDDTAPSTGAGEAGIVPVAAVIANAVFDLTGQRYRELPLQKYLK